MVTEKTERARQLRDRQTKAESLLWSVLRAKQLCGLKFRRQHPIGPFIADFACASRNVIIELDGGYHDYQYEEDVARQQYLEDQEWSIIRFANEDVLDDVEVVAISIANHLGLKAEFGRRQPNVSGMKVSKKPSPGPLARPLPKGEVTGTGAGVPDAETTTKLVLLWLVVGLINCAGIGHAADTRTRANVLFLAIDDLNDWVGCLGGHPQAKTPNIDKLAQKGVLFEQAYCAAPLCNPSRTSVMTGLRPSTTGIYGNLNWFRDLPSLEDWVTIPQYFRKHGYIAWTGGKIYHQPHGKWSDPEAWDKQYTTSMGTQSPLVGERYRHGMRDEFTNKILARLIDWAPIQQSTEETPDWKTAAGAASFLKLEHDKPFFLACGIYRPHLQWYAPKKYFDMHPIEKVELPAYLENDLDDVPPRGQAMAGKSFGIIRRNGQWKNAVQGYLAASSFADDCVGHVLDALEQSRYRDNTIVVLWGDHGYHIGDKDHFAKSALWEQTTRTPLIIYAPDRLPAGVPANGKSCKHPVSLVDIYPTLIELCGLPKRQDLDGRSLAPLVRNPDADWPWPAIITHSPHWHGTNHAIRTRQFHYIHYGDGREELYDAHNDPNQWKNLADDPKYAKSKEKLRKWLPKTNAKHFRRETLIDK